MTAKFQIQNRQRTKDITERAVLRNLYKPILNKTGMMTTHI